MNTVKVIIILLTGIGIGIVSILFYCKGKGFLIDYIANLIEIKSVENTEKAEKNILNRLYKHGILI